MVTRTASLTSARGAARRPSLLARLRMARALRRQRRALASLSDERLADIGLTRDEALREAARPLWDVPRHWLR
ncbi:DUF1127 domain-containing protein [Celeribacter indicus]|nr:DUF1127 domain-containing protein [Celeribacter indicus]SDW50732.1 protein of unknown function [Celeribacter indicus]